MRSSGTAATSRRYTGRSASDRIERAAPNGATASSAPNQRGGGTAPRSGRGGVARRPRISAVETVRMTAAAATAARRPNATAIGPASGDPAMFPAKYAPSTSQIALPSCARGTVAEISANITGSEAEPDQYSADPTNAPCQSPSGTNDQTPRVEAT